MKQGILAAVFLTHFVSLASANPLSVKFPKTVPMGSELVATLQVPGKVGYRSDLLKRPQTVNGETDNHGRIRLGKLSAPGVYSVWLNASGDEFNGLVIATELPGKHLSLKTISFTHPKVSYPPQERDLNLFRRFAEKVTHGHVKQALQKTIPKYLRENAVSITGTFVICLIPGGQPVCVARAGSHAVEFGLDFIKCLIEVVPLPSEDKKTLKVLISLGSYVGKTWGSAFKGDVAGIIAAQATLVTDLAGAEGLSLGIKLTDDFHDKFTVILDVAKKSQR